MSTNILDEGEIIPKALGDGTFQINIKDLAPGREFYFHWSEGQLYSHLTRVFAAMNPDPPCPMKGTGSLMRELQEWQYIQQNGIVMGDVGEDTFFVNIWKTVRSGEAKHLNVNIPREKVIKFAREVLEQVGWTVIPHQL